MKPTAIALEPTGYHYSAFLANVCKEEEIGIYWVGHSEVNHYRRSHRLPDKNDAADALALAAYLWEKHGHDEFFLQFSPGVSKELRENYLKLQSLNKMQNPIINRLRQQLSVEFPEVALTQSRANATGIAPLWGWLAEENISNHATTIYNKKWDNSVSKKYGGNISHFSRFLAKEICNFHREEKLIEDDLKELLKDKTIQPYIQILDEFGMKARTKALILSQVYPISRFDSLPPFKKRLGCAGEENSSGDRFGFNTRMGSKLSREAMYLWVLTVIAPKKSRPLTPQCQKLGLDYDNYWKKFYGSTEGMQAQVAKRELEKSKVKVKRILDEQVKPLLKKGSEAEVDGQIELLVQTLLSTNSQNFTETIAKNIKHSEIKKGFGNLIIMKVAGKACKMLFKELKCRISLSFQ
ncbi:MAG: transposase [Symploca sp. SIO2G7]|nr:transposase [Symploca sp. SIO2G7]